MDAAGRADGDGDGDGDGDDGDGSIPVQKKVKEWLLKFPVGRERGLVTRAVFKVSWALGLLENVTPFIHLQQHSRRLIGTIQGAAYYWHPMAVASVRCI